MSAFVTIMQPKKFYYTGKSDGHVDLKTAKLC